MSVFLSWSGPRSRAVAEALRAWLPYVFPGLRPWMSDKDVPAGHRWSPELTNQLRKARCSVICVTSDNASAPWLLFEAGVLSTSLDEAGAVCPYLVGVDVADIVGPLSQFHVKKADLPQTTELVLSLNQALDSQRSEDELRQLVPLLWPALKQRIEAVPPSDLPVVQRPERELLDELVAAVRGISNNLGGLERKEREILDDVLAIVRGLQGTGSVDRRVSLSSILELDSLVAEAYADRSPPNPLTLPTGAVSPTVAEATRIQQRVALRKFERLNSTAAGTLHKFCSRADEKYGERLSRIISASRGLGWTDLDLLRAFGRANGGPRNDASEPSRKRATMVPPAKPSNPDKSE